jgi:hypothetical protein
MPFIAETEEGWKPESPLCADSTQPLPISEILQLSIPASATPVQPVRDFLVEIERFATNIRAVRQGPEAAIGAHLAARRNPLFVVHHPPAHRHDTLRSRFGMAITQ